MNRQIFLGQTAMHSSFSMIVGIEVYITALLTKRKKVKGNQKELD